ncbi:hypothetical protein A3F62_05105 [Candidatus Woesebacteria bacterium RIFCSPHIGHO2_12_FULL_44_11]|nr:MAG: hypothetical protein A3F62_05105 [Candidatus Woesebacteria bacterium RIFCSPHIGHO2_12_FULL_44_11]
MQKPSKQSVINYLIGTVIAVLFLPLWAVWYTICSEYFDSIVFPPIIRDYINIVPFWLWFFLIIMFFIILFIYLTNSALLQNITTSLGLTLLLLLSHPLLFDTQNFGGGPEGFIVVAFFMSILADISIMLIYARRAGYLVSFLSLITGLAVLLLLLSVPTMLAN